MYCQDNVLKNNWPFERGQLYVIGCEGSTPRRSNVEISIILWPEVQKETTRKYFVVPITYDLEGLDPESDLVLRVTSATGKPFAARIDRTHVVPDYLLLSYVGRISDKTAAKILSRVRQLYKKYFEDEGGHPDDR